MGAGNGNGNGNGCGEWEWGGELFLLTKIYEL